MTSARYQPLCRYCNSSIGCLDGTRINPRNITHRNTSSFIHNNHFCLTWKSNGVSFNQVIEHELKSNFEIVDVLTDKHVKSFIKYDYKPIEVQSPLTNIVVLDLEFRKIFNNFSKLFERFLIVVVHIN